MKHPRIFPILLAAGKPSRPHEQNASINLAGRTALQMAVENCTHLERPIVILGFHSEPLRATVPANAHIVVNHRWRAGQLSSLLVGLRKVPLDSAFLLYPTDLVFLTRPVIRTLVAGFRRRTKTQKIVMPVYRGRDGHPVIFAAELRAELTHAQTARDVVYADPRRIKRVLVSTSAIWKDLGLSSRKRT
ncbi:MAG TPA: NTP transferase domain-containing protein [Candidatus Acidoferrales bacterium]|nr:NTP transferase domain-containing protein [Candidatus Acidoferrales bacterium]